MNSVPAPESAGASSQLRFGLLVFGVAALLNLHFFTVGWDHNLLGIQQFRQSQTAISTLFYLRNGVSLDYITPVLGPPWQVPLEFPLFQASVAAFVRLTGLALDPSGRLVSWLFFLSALPAAYLLLGRFRLPAGHRLCLLALLLLCPSYLYFSRLFMIESTAFSAGVWFLLGFSRVVEDRRLGWLPVVWLGGSLSGMVKVTTWTVFLTAAGLLCFARWVRDPRLAARETRLVLLLAVAAILPPLLTTLGWTWHAKHIRALNPASFFLNSHFGYWSFGDLAQRLSWTYWSRTFRVWADQIVGEAGLAMLVLYFAWLRGRHLRAVIGCLVAFISGQLIFSNLYWVHDYYFYASALFLVGAVGFCLVEILEHPAIRPWGRRALVIAILFLQVSAFDRTLLPLLQAERPVPQLFEVVSSISEPNDVIVILGQDWDATLPYYTGRKALMLLNGNENEPARIWDNIARLDPHKVAAVVVTGPHWNDTGLVNRTMSVLKLGPQPFIFDPGNSGIWVPLERQVGVSETFSTEQFPSFRIAPTRSTNSDGAVLGAGQIRRRGEFRDFKPRPVHARTLVDFADTVVEGRRFLVTHSTTELVFTLPRGATRVTAMFGISEPAYSDGNRTDGIELVFSRRLPDDNEDILYSRYLNPLNVETDRGVQPVDFALPPGLTGELIVKVLPGPANDASFDWAYFGQMTIQ